MSELIPRGAGAVMAGRHDPRDSLDHFPTPPWATRALVEQVIGPDTTTTLHIWEPACGDGAMVKPLRESGAEVVGTDVHDYGRGFPVVDFLNDNAEDALPWRPDWIITNPPFNKALDFALKATSVAAHGVALFVRLSWLEGCDRHERLFTRRRPALICPFAERVPLVKGRLDGKVSSATAYAWFVWRTWHGFPNVANTAVHWIPPCRKRLEREGDYGPLEDLFSREA